MTANAPDTASAASSPIPAQSGSVAPEPSADCAPYRSALWPGDSPSPANASAETGLPTARFALAVYDRLRRSPGNLLFAPASLQNTLAFVLSGADGETALQIARTLGAGPLPATALEGVADRLRHWRGAAQRVDLLAAERLWADSGVAWNPEFTQRLARTFGPVFATADFVNATDQSIAAINAWVSTATQTHISRILRRENFDSLDTRMLLVDGFYFHAAWARAFRRGDTTQRPFQVADQPSVMVPTIAGRTRGWVRRGGSIQIAELRYRGDEFALDLIMPSYPLACLEEALTPDLLGAWLADPGGESDDIRVQVPRFEVRGGASLRETLAFLGMPLAFEPAHAEFSSMARVRPDQHLYVQQVLQRTAFGFDAQAPPPQPAGHASAPTPASPTPPSHEPSDAMQFDRPFLFVVRDLRTGSILLIGRMADPRP